MLVRVGPQTTRPPKGGLSSIREIAMRENLERAKGLEPSTPTLARSCSTTELHPHPRWRRTRAVNGRPMPNADRECNSPRAIRRHTDNPISSTKGSESVRNNAEKGFAGPLGPMLGTQGPATQRKRGGDSSYFRASLHTSPVNSPPRSIAIEGPLARLDGASTLPAGSAPRKAACRLNFTAKPPSSE
jgi:hypothetical protein